MEGRGGGEAQGVADPKKTANVVPLDLQALCDIYLLVKLLQRH
jgi:hypothetical protein